MGEQKHHYRHNHFIVFQNFKEDTRVTDQGSTFQGSCYGNHHHHHHKNTRVLGKHLLKRANQSDHHNCYQYHRKALYDYHELNYYYHHNHYFLSHNHPKLDKIRQEFMPLHLNQHPYNRKTSVISKIHKQNLLKDNNHYHPVTIHHTNHTLKSLHRSSNQ